MTLDPWIITLGWVNLVGGSVGLVAGAVLELLRAARRRHERKEITRL